MRTLDSDIARVKREGLTALHACTEKLPGRTGSWWRTLVGVKDVDVLRAEPSPPYILRAARSVQSSISSRVGLGGALSELCCEWFST